MKFFIFYENTFLMKRKIIILLITSLAVTLLSMSLLQSSGINPLPFTVMPEEEGEHDGDHQYPNYDGSVKIGEDDENNLENLTKITKEDAESKALEYTTGGTIKSSELENENGNLVWKVVVEFEGNLYEIAIDAGNGEILWASAN